MLERVGRLPDAVVACVGGGSNAIGIFTAFVPDDGVRLVGFEAAGDGVETGRHAATITGGSPGVLHGARSYLLQDDNGQTLDSHSISAGLDYPGVGPEHSYLHDIGRAEYRPITDAQAMSAFALLCRTEGIIPAIESAHALAGALDLGRELGPDAVILINLSGRGDKDVETASKWFGLTDPDEVTADNTHNNTETDTGSGTVAGRPRTRVMSGRWRTSSAKARAENRAALIGYLPVGYPDVDASIAAMLAMVAGRRGHRRGRRALQRPGHGRPGHPACGRPGGAGRHVHDRRAACRPGGGRGRAGRGDDLLEPGRAVRGRTVRRRPGRGRRLGRDHARPHPGRGR